MSKLIDTIELPRGLRTLSLEELKTVAHELRDELIETVSGCGGHFASSLGANEISVALHHVFQTPDDRIIWDTGHQGYIHKMLTGRRERLATIRKKDGLSGFLRRTESEFDCFGAGHAGTSISAAVGMAVALSKSAPERKVVACIGDGAITAGMAFEALNHAGDLGLKNLIVVLNDNEMSISPNVGALSWLFSKTVTSQSSSVARFRFKELYRKGFIPEFVYKAIDRAEEAAQGFLAPAAALFESFGFRYIGPIDGHNIEELVAAFESAKRQDVPVLIHAYTVKGKGYEAAEEDPIKWHGVTPFDAKKAEFHPAKGQTPPSFTSVFADTVTALAKDNPRVVAITAAMPTGTGLDKFQKVLPGQFFDVGICEQHAVTFAAGLACEGMKPIVAIYSTFLQRGYDQVVHDVCIQNLPVVIAMDRGGVVGNDGDTHQGLFDVAFLRTLPNIAILSPKDENEFRHMLKTAVAYNGPIAIRYPRGNGAGVALDAELKELPIGKAEVLVRGSDALLIAFGPMVQYALTVAKKLSASGIQATVINARFAKPLDAQLFAEELPQYPIVCTMEDHALAGGFGSAVVEFINDSGLSMQCPVQRFGIQDQFVTHASQSEQHQMNGCDPESILRYVLAHHKSGKVVVNA